MIGNEIPIFGGGHTLALRLLQWSAAKGIPTFWMGVRNPNDKRMEDGIAALGLTECVWGTGKPGFTIIDCARLASFSFDGVDEIVTICVCKSALVAAEILKQRYPGIRFNNFLYSVVRDEFIQPRKPLSLHVAAKLHSFPQSVIDQMYIRNMVAFMDSKGAEINSVRQGLARQELRKLAMPIASTVLPFSAEDVCRRWSGAERVITTCTRLDFPFKAYVLDLVDAFEALASKWDNVHLQIIGDGPGKTALLEKISAKPETLQKKITWISYVPYEKLNRHLRDSYVYIGMGTTILDAVNNGVPAIPVVPYEAQCMVDGMFYENWENLGGITPGSPCLGALLEKLMQMDMPSYLTCAERCHQTYQEHYDINVIMPKWLAKRNSQCDPLLTKGQIRFYNAKTKLYLLLRKAYLSLQALSKRTKGAHEVL